uniref:Zinc finger CCHC domain-containing protein 3-like n=1 Tax=Petromyzon marinus TaxID=7757 RepID=A0AAJ7UJ14_PETMA|nr:zinc finger CCHC domain-containing protein 3-like [Petromyzon marinus]
METAGKETRRTPRTMEGARGAESDGRDGAGQTGAGEVMEFKDDVEEEVTLDRTTFVRTGMLRMLRVEVADLSCLIALPGGRAFDVSFKSNLLLQNFLTHFEERAGEKPLTSMRTRLLSDLETKVVTVFLYNEALHDQDVEVWLRQHCVLLSGCKRVQDVAGIWTGARQWRVRLKMEGWALRHIPSALNIGGNKGYVVYAGQSKLCRRCGGRGHLAAACKARICYRCKSPDYTVEECGEPVRCNLCGSRGHLYRSYPESYANRVRAYRNGQAGEVAKEVAGR